MWFHPWAPLKVWTRKQLLKWSKSSPRWWRILMYRIMIAQLINLCLISTQMMIIKRALFSCSNLSKSKILLAMSSSKTSMSKSWNSLRMNSRTFNKLRTNLSQKMSWWRRISWMDKLLTKQCIQRRQIMLEMAFSQTFKSSSLILTRSGNLSLAHPLVRSKGFLS